MSHADDSGQADLRNSARRKTPNPARLPSLGVLLVVVATAVIGWWQNANPPGEQPAPPPVIAADDGAEIKPGADLDHGPAEIDNQSSTAPDEAGTERSAAQTSRPIRGQPPVISGELDPPASKAGSGDPLRGTNPQTKPRPPPDLTERSRSPLIQQVTLKNQDGRVIYQGPIDLQLTIDRIEKGERNQHRNDGTVFQNREGKLARKPAGYYHEYVVPTPDQHGPGPQRLILGNGGEVYYTSDHYRSFKKIPVKIAVPR